MELEDITITFFTDDDNNNVIVKVRNTFTGEEETYIEEDRRFFNALAIAVHFDGMPDYKVDYPDAEKAMRNIRWIA